MDNYKLGDPKPRGPRRLSQGAIARAAKLSPSAVSRVFSRGSGRLSTLRKICRAAGMTLDDFVRLYGKVA